MTATNDPAFGSRESAEPPEHTYAIATFYEVGPGRPVASRIRTYTRDFDPMMKGCMVYQVRADSVREARKLAVAHRLQHEINQWIGGSRPPKQPRLPTARPSLPSNPIDDTHELVQLAKLDRARQDLRTALQEERARFDVRDQSVRDWEIWKEYARRTERARAEVIRRIADVLAAFGLLDVAEELQEYLPEFDGRHLESRGST